MNQISLAAGLFVCHTCKVRHPCANHKNYLDKLGAHAGHATSYLDRDWLASKGHHKLAAWDPRRMIRSFLGLEALEYRMAIEGYVPNADSKQGRESLVNHAVTALHSLANSATAGWQSAEINNETDLYLDRQMQAVLDFANTAPANSRCAYVFAAGALETGKLSNPFSGSESALTLTDVTTTEQNAARIGRIPYTTQDEVVEGRPMSVAAAHGGVLPARIAFGIMNHSGAALAGSGNTVKSAGIYVVTA